jgi:hypothetical protein
MGSKEESQGANRARKRRNAKSSAPMVKFLCPRRRLR